MKTRQDYDFDVRKAALEEATYATVSEFASLRSTNKLAGTADLDEFIIRRARIFEEYLRGGTYAALRVIVSRDENAERADLDDPQQRGADRR